jgi:hypothetical protein
MRRVLGLVLFCSCWTVVDPVRAGEADDLVDQAIKAHGGTEALTRSQTALVTSSVTRFGAKPITFKTEAAMMLPDRWRSTCYHEGRVLAIIAINGDHGWTSTGGPPQEMGKELLTEQRNQGYLLWLTTLVPLKRSDVKLKLTAEIKVNDHPAVGVLVSRTGWPNARLYFDKKTHLLVKIDRYAKVAGEKVYEEHFYGDHKTFDGANLPTREEVRLEDKRITEETGREYKFPRTIDENQFKRP